MGALRQGLGVKSEDHFLGNTFSEKMPTVFENLRTFLCKKLCAQVPTLYREAEGYVSLHQTSKHQGTSLDSVPNLNSRASSPFSER